jgi:hypothetical protein
MTDKPVIFWHAASDEPLDKIESALCDGPECTVTQQCRTVFNEIHRLRAALESKATEAQAGVERVSLSIELALQQVNSELPASKAALRAQLRNAKAAIDQINTILKGEGN